MNLPTEIKINSIPYQIEYTDEKEDHDGNRTRYGKVVFADNRIVIFRSNQAKEAIWSSIWHEITHVILGSMHFGMSDQQEELLVETIATGISSVFFDNNLFKE